jgi:hypothetical protein
MNMVHGSMIAEGWFFVLSTKFGEEAEVSDRT